MELESVWPEVKQEQNSSGDHDGNELDVVVGPESSSVGSEHPVSDSSMTDVHDSTLTDPTDSRDDSVGSREDDETITVKQEPVDWVIEEACHDSDDETMTDDNLDTQPTSGRETEAGASDNEDDVAKLEQQSSTNNSFGALRIKFKNFRDHNLSIKNEPLDLSAGSLKQISPSRVPIYKPVKKKRRKGMYKSCDDQQAVLQCEASTRISSVPFSVENASLGTVFKNYGAECVQGSDEENIGVVVTDYDDEEVKVYHVDDDTEEDNEMESLPIHFLSETTESKNSALTETERKKKTPNNSTEEQDQENPYDLSSRSGTSELNGNLTCTEFQEQCRGKLDLLLQKRKHMSAENLSEYVEVLASQVVAENEGDDSYTLQCELCPSESPLRFKNNFDLERHQRLIHRPKTPIECPHCPMTFTSENQLGGHLKVHFGQQRRRCQHCSEEFKCAYDCMEHEKTVHSDKKSIKCVFRSPGDPEPPNLHEEKGEKNSFKCKLCPLAFICASDLTSHMKVHKMKKAKGQTTPTSGQGAGTGKRGGGQGRCKGPRTCPHCGAEFKNGKNLRSHIRVHSTVKPYTCDQCPAAFVRSSDLKRHKKTHSGEKAYKCNLCQSAFADSSKLKIHMRIHTGEKPFKCELCPDAFSQASQYSRHMRVHNGEKPFQCQYCPSAFTMTSDYRRHLKIHTGERPFMCEYCPASFPEAKNLRIHVRTHTGEKPYKCDICSAAFAQTANLKRHLKTHTGERPAKCDLCPSAFADNHKLRVHMRSHSGEKPYQCAKCPSAFATSSALNRHNIMHSGEKPYKCEQCPAMFAHMCKLKLHEQCHTLDGPFKCQYCTASFKNAYGLTVHSHLHE